MTSTGVWFLVLGQIALLFSLSVSAQKAPDRPVPLDPIEGERQAGLLVAEMLAETPEQNTTNTGRLSIRDGEGNRRELAVKFEIYSPDPQTVISVYEATGRDGPHAITRLMATHKMGQPNQYELAESAGTDTAKAHTKMLSGGEVMAPFAGSDFWVADLGLEFLHWPKQRLLRKEFHHQVSCGVLESINRNPGAGGYARIVSWIDLEPPHGIVHADAYDANGKRIKQFDPKTIKKIQGQYKLEAMEMVDERTKSRTVITFDLKPE